MLYAGYLEATLKWHRAKYMYFWQLRYVSSQRYSTFIVAASDRTFLVMTVASAMEGGEMEMSRRLGGATATQRVAQ